MINILITGASSRIGKVIIKSLEKYDNINLYTTSRSKFLSTNHIKHDLSFPLNKNFSKFPKKIHCIIHLASLVDESNKEFKIIEKNLLYAYNLAEYANHACVNKVINISSIAVYGSPFKNNDYNEKDECRPISNYGLSKYLSEQIFSSHLNKKITIGHFRLGYTITPFLRESSILKRFDDALKNNKDVTLINANSSKLNLIDARDLSSAINAFISGNYSGIFNCVTHSIIIKNIFDCIKNKNSKSKSKITSKQDSKTSILSQYSSKKFMHLIENNFYDWKDSIFWALDQHE